MKRIHRAGAAIGLSGSLFAAALAPASAPALTVTGERCPRVQHGTTETHIDNPATETISKLGTFTLGALLAKCQRGEIAPSHANNAVTFTWDSRTVGTADLFPTRAYTLSLTAPEDSSGNVDPGQIARFAIEEAATFGDAEPTVGIKAEHFSTGWFLNVAEPLDGELYRFGGNTGASIAEPQAASVASFGQSMLADVLERAH